MKLALWLLAVEAALIFVILIAGNVAARAATRERTLTLAAVILSGQPVVAHCAHPPGTPWSGNFVGYATWPPSEVWIRHCRGTVALVREDVSTFAHEVLHVEHHGWSERRVYATESSYEPAARRAIVRAESITAAGA